MSDEVRKRRRKNGLYISIIAWKLQDADVKSQRRVRTKHENEEWWNN